MTRTLVLPVPNFCTSASAIATSRKLVSESFSGTSTVASPLASSDDVAVPEQQRVEQLARRAAAAAAAGGGSALRP